MNESNGRLRCSSHILSCFPAAVCRGRCGPVSAQLFLHGTMITVVVAVVEPPLVLAGAKLGACFRQSRRASLWMDRGLGASFVALGARLAASTR